MITLIAASLTNGGIGHDGGLPWGPRPADLRHFKSYTMNKTIVVGRRTAEKLPPLPGRDILVLSRKTTPTPWAILGRAKYEEIVIAGGAQIYALFAPHADKIVHTCVNTNAECDTFLPPEWLDACRRMHITSEGPLGADRLTIWERR